MIIIVLCLGKDHLKNKVHENYNPPKKGKPKLVLLSTLGLADFAKIISPTLSVHVASDKRNHKPWCLGKHPNPDHHLYFNLRLKIRI